MTANPLHSQATGMKPGDKLGNFDVIEQIGVGGMSVVWKGYDRVLGKAVAIKQIAPDLVAGDEHAAADFRKRFGKEAMLQKRVATDHPHIVRVYDYIEAEQGLFIVMEYIEGVSLEDVLAGDGEPMNVRQALGIVAATAAALETMHAKGVIHRDLKPSNILIPKEGGLKVSDFGLATLVADQDAMSLGSVRYMAPEMFGTEKVDARADIYSLGIIAYELLAGRDKFNEAFKLVLRDQRNQALRWMKWHTNARVQAPTLSKINPSVLEPVSELVGRMMAKDGLTRISSAADLIEAIRRQVTGETEAASARVAVEARAKAAKQAAAVAGEATAVLPKRSKVPMLIAAMVIFWTLVAGGLYMYVQSQKVDPDLEAFKAADARFNEARQFINDEPPDYRVAMPIFAALAKEWTGHENPRYAKLGKASKVRELWSAAHIAIKQKQYDEALDLFDQVRAFQVFDGGQIYDLTREVERLRAYEQNVALIKSHLVATDKARGNNAVNQAKGHLSNARQELRNQFDNASAYTEAEMDSFRALEGEVHRRMDLIAVDEILDEVANLIALGDRTRARDRLAEEVNKYETDSRLQTELNKLTAGMKYDDFINAAKQSEAANQFDAAITHYSRADEIRASDTVKQQIAILRGKAALQAGERLLADGDNASAVAKFKETLNYPGAAAQRAQRLLDQLATMAAFEQAVAKGQQAEAAGDFAAARQFYDKALTIQNDPSVRDRIRDIRIRTLALQAADHLRKQELDEAKAVAQQVLDLDPDHKAAASVIQNASIWGDYFEYIGLGDTARAAKEYGSAKRQYRKARDIALTDEATEKVETLLDHTEFEDWYDKAQDAAADGAWSEARINVTTASRITRLTPEMRAKLSDLSKMIEANRPKDEEG